MYLGCCLWSQFEGIEDDELRDLASSLPGVVLSGRAPATAKSTVEHSHGGRGGLPLSKKCRLYRPNPFLWHYISITCYKHPRRMVL